MVSPMRQDLQSLNLCAYQGNDLADVIGGESLDWLSLTQGKIHSLNGLHKAKILEVAFLVLSAKSDGYLRPGKRKEYLIPAVP